MDNNILTGDLYLEAGIGWLSKQIRRFTKSKVNHSGIAWYCYGKLFIIEENKYKGGIGLIATPIEDKKDKKYYFRRPNFAVDGSEYGKFMLTKLGKFKYSKFDLIIAQPIYLLSGKRLWIGGKTMKDNKTVCSGFCGFVYDNFTGLYPNWYKMSPADFVDDPNFTDLK